MGFWGDPSHSPNPGKAGGLARRAGAAASSERRCQLSATSLLPPSFQPRHNWLRQPHITNKRLLTTNEVLRKALSSFPAARAEAPAAATAGKQAGCCCQLRGALPCTSSHSPQTPAHPIWLYPHLQSTVGKAPPCLGATRHVQNWPWVVAVGGCQAGRIGGRKPPAAAQPQPGGDTSLPPAEWHVKSTMDFLHQHPRLCSCTPRSAPHQGTHRSAC